jgi:hypothetical protein
MSKESFDDEIEKLNIEHYILLLENANYKKLLSFQGIDIISYDEIEKKIEQNEIEMEDIEKLRKKLFTKFCKLWIINKPSSRVSTSVASVASFASSSSNITTYNKSSKSKAGKTKMKQNNVPVCKKCGFQATAHGGYGSHIRACEGPLPACDCTFHSKDPKTQREHLRKCMHSTHKIRTKSKKNQAKGKGKGKAKPYYYYYPQLTDEEEISVSATVKEKKEEEEKEEFADIEDAISNYKDKTEVEDGDSVMDFYSSGTSFPL